MRKYPFVKQRSLKDCGVACTLMILKYYKGYMSMDKLSELLKVSNCGTSAYHIVNFFNTHNFKCEGYKYDDLSHIKCPCIVHIKLNSYNHYAVVWEIKRGWILASDPSKGNLKIQIDNFLKMWTGICICMKPIGVIPKEKEVNFYAFLYKYVKPRLKQLLVLYFLSLTTSFLFVALSFFIQISVSYIELAEKVIIIFTLMFILNVLISYMRNIILIKFNIKFDKSLEQDIFKKIISLPHTSYRRKTTGELVSYFNDLSIIKDFITKISIVIFMNVPLIIIIYIYLLVTQTPYIFICLITMIMHFIIYQKYKNKNYFLSSEIQVNKASVNSYITESISGIGTVKNLNLEDKILGRFKEKYRQYIKCEYTLNKTLITQIFMKDLISNLSTVIIVLCGIYNIKNGQPLHEFMTVYFILSLSISSYKEILDLNYDFSSVKSALYHIGDIEEKNKKKINVNGDIIIKNLNYTYDDINKAINNVNLNIKLKEKIMVSGESGSGKSTLFKMIKGYYNYGGSILIGSYEAKEYDFQDIKYISQKEKLFTASIYDELNITKKYNQICEINFIEEDMIIEEDGKNLSDGQKQRLYLSRALDDFKILIIDESLSSIDINMERRILKRLINLYRDKTIIFISHRLDNLDLFDRFIEMKDGKIVLDEVRCE